jgi:hypothetical protein
MDETPEDASQKKRVVNTQLENVVQLLVACCKQLVQLLSLNGRPWEAIEDESIAAGEGVKMLLYEPDNQVVGHEFTTIHHSFHLS